jgi:hypothetical protein
MYESNKGGGIKWATEARSAGLKFSARGTIVELTARFTPGDAQAYAMAESKVLGHLQAVPTTSAGSVWGDTSDGVGGALAVGKGSLSIKASGVSKRFIAGLA